MEHTYSIQATKKYGITYNNLQNLTDTQTLQLQDIKMNYTICPIVFENSDYYILTRLYKRDGKIEMDYEYQKIIENESISADQKAIAQKEISKINEQKNSIMIAENLIKVKGFEDLIIFINGENVSVIVKSDKLEEKEIAQIQNIVTRELGVKIENINISNK